MSTPNLDPQEETAQATHPGLTDWYLRQQELAEQEARSDAEQLTHPVDEDADRHSHD